MSKAPFDVGVVRDLMSDATVAFGIPAYNEGDGVLPTLHSLWEGLSSLHLTSCQLILSDSYDEASRSSALPASVWARRVGAKLEIESSDRRRSAKEALNVVFDCAVADVLILVNADVLVPMPSLLAMLHSLFAAPRTVAAIGATLPDPAFSDLKHRAGAWQLRAVTRAASLAPRSVTGPKSLRSEGAFCGAWRTFYSTFRFPIGSGSTADDVELTRALVNGGYACLNLPEAFVYKVPTGSLDDLCFGQLRSQVAMPEHRRRRTEYAAAIIEATLDPLGAFLYGWGRIWCRRHRSRILRESASEQWRPTSTTKRRTTDE